MSPNNCATLQLIHDAYRYTSSHIQNILLQAYSSLSEGTRLVTDAKSPPPSFLHDGSLIAVWVLICGLERRM